jgi:hypothetical protein
MICAGLSMETAIGAPFLRRRKFSPTMWGEGSICSFLPLWSSSLAEMLTTSPPKVPRKELPMTTSFRPKARWRPSTHTSTASMLFREEETSASKSSLGMSPGPNAITGPTLMVPEAMPRRGTLVPRALGAGLSRSRAIIASST